MISRIDKTWYIYRKEYYTAMKINYSYMQQPEWVTNIILNKKKNPDIKKAHGV